MKPREAKRGGVRKGAGRPKVHNNQATKQRAYRDRSRALRNQAKFANDSA